MSFIADPQDISIERTVTAVKSAEELERLTVDERLKPIERAVYLLSSGQEVQRISVINSLPELLGENHVDCMRRIVPKIREVVRVAEAEMQLASCGIFLQILQQDLVPIQNYTQTFLQTILMCMDNKDAEISKVWLDTLLDVIELLPKDVVSKEILGKAVAKGQLSQSIQSRLASCKILGKAVTKFEPFVIKRDILPVVLALCQDVEFEVRACMSRLLEPVARGLGLEETKTAILPALVELTNDDHSFVRLAGLDTIISILTLLDSDAHISTVIPLVTKYCQHALSKQDETLSAVSKHCGKLCEGLSDDLTEDQRKYFIDFYRKLCRIGTNSKKSISDRCDVSPNVSGSSMKQPHNKSHPLSMIPSVYDIREHEQDDELEKCRQHAAGNFPAMVSFTGPKSFRMELASPFSQLCSDINFRVRETVASGFHQVVSQLGNNSHWLLRDLIELLNDNSIEVLRSGFISKLPETLHMMYHSCLAAEVESKFSEVLPALLSCEIVVFASNNWRLQEEFISALSCITPCFPSDVIHDRIVPLVFRKLHIARALPVRRSAARTLLLLMRSNRRLEQRQEICRRMVDELARSRSFYERSLYIDLCAIVLELYSRTFFKEHFAEALLGLYDDSVPNIRLRLCRLLPQVKRSFRLPSDKALNGLLDSCVRQLASNEKDSDVKDALERAVLEMKHRLMSHDSFDSQDEDDLSDRKKAEEESHLLELEDYDRRVEEDNQRQKDKKKDKQVSKLPTPKKDGRMVMSPHASSAANNRGAARPPSPASKEARKSATSTNKVSSGKATGRTSLPAKEGSSTPASSGASLVNRKNSTSSLTGTTNSTGVASSPKGRASVGVVPSAVNQTDKRVTQRRTSTGSPFPLDKKK